MIKASDAKNKIMERLAAGWFENSDPIAES
jgi:hypothetical protein